MKRLTILLLFILLITGKPYACGPDYEPDSDYYNLFMQEIIDDPQYYPFLLSSGSPFYEKEEANILNENIEEWADYLKVGYEDARYLVFDVSYENLSNLIDGKKNKDNKLNFITPDFLAKHKQALQYLLYAKYLEPYMSVASSDNSWWWYYPEDRGTVGDLNYNEVMLTLQKNWKSTQDKELKLRYGYQLVRFAHYNGNYDEAIKLFATYVSSLNHKPAMYYHALSQKAGAERGLGRLLQANRDFFEVFSNSKNLKKMAMISMRMWNENFNKDFLDEAKTREEKNGAYLLLGYLGFSNPLNEIEKIVKNSPDAIQAKVLMARAVNTIERELLSLNTYFYYYREEDASVKNIADKRYPMIKDAKAAAFFNNTMALADKMTLSSSVKDKNYWHLTSAYLHFLNKDFSKAKDILAKVEAINGKYTEQKNNLSMYIDICEQPVIDSQVENMLYTKYKKQYFSNTKKEESNIEYSNVYDTKSFITDILANRYYIQKEYGKAFLLHNDIETLKYYPDLELLSEIESFYNKNNKTDLEKYIVKHLTSQTLNEINYIRGIIHLTDADLDEALISFNKIKGRVPDSIPDMVFGYNRIESFESRTDTVMVANYFSDFPFIRKIMNERQLAESLVKLRDIGEQNTNLSAKANYLLGNFFYNATRTGYYRHILRFDSTNENCNKFRMMTEADLYTNIYFKYYPMFYKNNVQASQSFLEKAYAQAADNTLKARIAFALSKCEQEAYYDKNNIDRYHSGYGNSDDDGILITKRKYFKELAKYKNTEFYKKIRTYCMYFDYYVDNCM